MNSTNALDDKLLKRQQKLNEWKLKKQQQQQQQQHTLLELSDNDPKKQERLKRIQEWKKKKLAKSADYTPQQVPNVAVKPFLTLKRPRSGAKAVKQSVFEDDENQVKPVFKKPTLESTSKDQYEDIDLDQFITSLDNSESQPIVSEIDQSDSDSEDSVDDVEIDIVSDQIRKLQDKQKSLEVVDHSKINYRPFRKQFYVQPQEYNNLTIAESNEIRKQWSDIFIKGNNCPLPISKWSQLGLSSALMNILNKMEYQTPSPIQCQALPAIMQGRDVIAVAKTGSGKTLAFIIPMVRHILDQADLEPDDGPIGVIITPTRELALQIHKELENFTKDNRIKSCCCYGGSSIETQIGELKKGVHAIVGTPGRIIDLLGANSGRITNLRRTTYLVLDEADRMYDMGFEPQVNKIISQIRPDKQTVLFSATFPRKLELLARLNLNDPVQIIIGGIGKVAEEIEQKFELFEDTDSEEISRKKFLKLVEIIDEFQTNHHDSRILIFVQKQDDADELMVQLVSSDYNCLSIHGGKDQIDRKHAIKEFLSNHGANILIATSIAARGLDVKNLGLVVNYDAPNHMEDYVHQVGRTGRAGAKGKAITFVTTSQERAITDLVKSMHDTNEIDSKLLQISDGFLKKVKQGKEKYSFGFGGKGLDHLQHQRDATKGLERESFNMKVSDTKEVVKDENDDDDIELPDFEVIEGKAPETSGPDKSKFYSRITINDLPKQTRWYAVQGESLSKIIEATETSITHKGQYYGPNAKIGKNDSPKLYLLVEGATKKAVEDANTMIKQKILQGLQNETSTGKYKV